MSQPERDPRPVDEVIESEGVARAIGLKYVASLLYTYRCNLACKHCLFNCGPHQPEVYASHEDGLEFLRQLHATDRAIHIAGGEALLHYDEVLKLCRAANEEGVAPHFIESNAKWCEDDSITRHRLTELKEAGVKGMLFSADPYHQVFFSPSNRVRAFQIADEVFGRENIAASDISLVELQKLKQIGRDQVQLADYVRKHQPRMVGRAGNHLAGFLPDRSLADLTDDSLWHGAHSGENCAREFDPETMWEIHIDPYGNIQTCCGIIVGNAHETPLPELMAKGFHTEMVRQVYERGPFGLLELAVEKGYQPLSGYAQKCHLCWEVRKFLRPWYPEAFGPAEIYEAPARERGIGSNAE